MRELVMWGLFGGLIPELIAIYKLREADKGTRPKWLTSFFYWIVTIVMILTGGALVFFYVQILKVQLNEILAIHIGASAPIILQGLAQGKIQSN
ncbi:hypothetical protein [Enterobacter sp. N18-03635]|uniref:hypothetical protein n=1 Tax=Enterobacter sp. N18-03635 TaxID=2500132 RepID=UPI000E37F79E|nr:hypothetical protein [Enterobacter sp. N18-03635]